MMLRKVVMMRVKYNHAQPDPIRWIRVDDCIDCQMRCRAYVHKYTSARF